MKTIAVIKETHSDLFSFNIGEQVKMIVLLEDYINSLNKSIKSFDNMNQKWAGNTLYNSKIDYLNLLIKIDKIR